MFENMPHKDMSFQIEEIICWLCLLNDSAHFSVPCTSFAQVFAKWAGSLSSNLMSVGPYKLFGKLGILVFSVNSLKSTLTLLWGVFPNRLGNFIPNFKLYG